MFILIVVVIGVVGIMGMVLCVRCLTRWKADAYYRMDSIPVDHVVLETEMIKNEMYTSDSAHGLLASHDTFR